MTIFPYFCTLFQTRVGETMTCDNDNGYFNQGLKFQHSRESGHGRWSWSTSPAVPCQMNMKFNFKGPSKNCSVGASFSLIFRSLHQFFVKSRRQQPSAFFCPVLRPPSSVPSLPSPVLRPPSPDPFPDEFHFVGYLYCQTMVYYYLCGRKNLQLFRPKLTKIRHARRCN